MTAHRVPADVVAHATAPPAQKWRPAMSSTRVLTELGDRIAEDGPAAHHRLLQLLAALVADLAPGAADALADSAAPPVVRQRALAVASAVLLHQPTGPHAGLALAA